MSTDDIREAVARARGPREDRDLRRRHARAHAGARRDRRRLRVGRRAHAFGAGRRHQLRNRTHLIATPRARGRRSRARGRGSAASARRCCSFRRIGSTNDVAARSAPAPAGDPKAPSSSPTRRPPAAAAAATPGFRRRAAGLYVSVVLAPATARVDPARATTLLTLAAGVALAEGDRGGDRAAASISSGRTICSSARRKLAGILAEASGRPPSRSSSATASTSRATAYPPELARPRDVARVGARTRGRSRITCSSRRSPRSRAATTTCSTAGSMLFSTPGARRAPGASGARVTWTTTAGARSGVTAGIDDRRRAAGAGRRSRRAHRRRGSHWL